MSSKEYELQQPPGDGITAVNFCPGTVEFLAVSSWDSTVRIYDVLANQMKTHYSHKSGVLDCCFLDRETTVSGGLDRTLKLVNIRTGAETTIGTHDGAIRCICTVRGERDLIISGSWDSTVKFWDTRDSNCIKTINQSQKVYSMSGSPNKLVVGTAGRLINIVDMRTLSEESRRESALRYQTRCVRIYPDERGFSVSSIEGRVAMEFFDPSPEVQNSKYQFKCHRALINGVDTVFPVNTLAFHKGYGTFASGGCDGIVNVWDGQNKKRVTQFHPYPTSIASLAFNDAGSLLAIASSYTFEEGEKEVPAPDQIFIRQVIDSEVRPKPRITASSGRV
ncbi:mitotic checkpoint protein BUB3 [Pelomyxa schiedti]|nr:mitotic checkpoint protein BUB3 [Pelomyxa schiedti]